MTTPHERALEAGYAKLKEHHPNSGLGYKEAFNASLTALLSDPATVDRVARAIAKEQGFNPDKEAARYDAGKNETYVMAGYPIWKDFMDESQAALQAIKEMVG